MCGGNNTDLYFMPFSRRDRSASGRLVKLYLAVDVVLGCTPPRADTANIVPPLSQWIAECHLFCALLTCLKVSRSRPTCLRSTSQFPRRVSTLWTTWRNFWTMLSFETPFILRTCLTLQTHQPGFEFPHSLLTAYAPFARKCCPQSLCIWPSGVHWRM